MCDYCEREKNIFKFETLDDWILTWGGDITKESSEYSENTIFIDRGFLRLVDPLDCGCLDHGDKIVINFCPICGEQLRIDGGLIEK